VISGATRVAGVIGDPVRHSLSPRLHNAAYAALGLDWIFAAFEVPDGNAGAALAAARAFGFVGLSVTMPHKRAIGLLCDDMSERAAIVKSVNTVTLAPNGEAIGDSTDGAGFLRSLADDGIDVADRTVVILGAGGAARAVAWSLGDAGAQVTVAARQITAATEAARFAGGTAVAWDDRADAAAGADIVVNATPIGMATDSELPLPVRAITARQVVADLVYEPRETPLLAAARAAGAHAVGGIGMLVHQAALQVEIWSGQPAPVAAMHAAVAAG
jgi:shikimate dehydrogenase